ncbi:hypothetical protein [Nocardioides dongxiaopingii]|uniref:hypothetical protein n=1 Tax=Nocardioides sp. S-1144 TaxID=2582905 RepID=UPI0016525A3C|nr:hypothetical protein [Nocardioides sp. S-1144]
MSWFRERLPAPWRDAAGLIALAMVVVQTTWRGVLLADGFLTQDDFQMTRIGRAPMSAEMLFQEYSGHVWPGNFVLAWANARLGPLDWPVFAVEIMLMQLVAAVLAWLVLCRLVPGSSLRLPVLAVALFCPLTWWPTAWWAAAIGFLPTSIAVLGGTWALLVHLQDRRRWAPVVIVVALVVGLQFQERAALLPLVLGFVAAAHAPSRGRRAVAEAWRARRGLWLVLIAVVLAYLVAHRALAPIETSDVGSSGGAVELIWNFVVRTAIPGLVGGPWTPDVLSDVILLPQVYAVVVAWLVLLALVVWSLRRGGRSVGWGWLLLLTYVVADVAVLFAGRTALGAALALSPRYAADIVPVLVVALGLVLREVERAPEVDRPPARPSRRRRGAVVLVTAAYAVSAVVTMDVIAPHTLNTADRGFVQTLRQEIRSQPDAVIVDTPPPDDVMTFWFGSDARVSTVVGLAPEQPLFNLPSHDLRIADTDGRLQPVELLGGESMRPAAADDACGYAVGERPVRIPLEDEVDGETMVARISYFTSVRGTLGISGGDTSVAGPLRAAGVLQVVLRGEVDAVTLNLEEEVSSTGAVDGAERPAGTVCVTGLAVGFPVARSGS